VAKNSKMNKYLIIRSVKAELLPFYIDKWKKKLQNSEFDLLTHSADVSSGVEIIENKYPEMFTNIYIYKKNADFNFMHIEKKVKYELKRRKYNSVIIPHKSGDIEGFSNVIIMAFVFSRKVYHGNIDGELTRISKLFILKYLVNSFIAGLIFLFVIPFIVLSLIKSIISFYIKQKALLKKSKYSW